jgi:hypothetical protein
MGWLVLGKAVVVTINPAVMTGVAMACIGGIVILVIAWTGRKKD